MIKRSIVALSISLLVIIAAVAVHWFGEGPKRATAPMATPKGVPSSQAVPKEKTREVTQSEDDSGGIVASTPTNDAIPNKIAKVSLNARIVWGGQPLSDAWLVVQLIGKRPDGLRDSSTPFRFTDMEAGPRSDQDGNINLNVVYQVGIPEDSHFEVAVFHPEKGTAYQEISLSELLAGEFQELEPERGEVVTGRIIGADGEPVVGALVEVGTTSSGDEASLDGLGTRTGPDGSFMIPGVRSGHVAGMISIYGKRWAMEDRKIITEVGTVTRGLDREKEFNEQDKTWYVGEITYITETHIRDLQTGEVTVAPSETPR